MKEGVDCFRDFGVHGGLIYRSKIVDGIVQEFSGGIAGVGFKKGEDFGSKIYG